MMSTDSSGRLVLWLWQLVEGVEYSPQTGFGGRVARSTRAAAVGAVAPVFAPRTFCRTRSGSPHRCRLGGFSAQSCSIDTQLQETELGWPHYGGKFLGAAASERIEANSAGGPRARARAAATAADS